MKTFKTDTTYYTRSTCDHNCIFEYTVISRTNKTITIKDKFNDVKKCRVNKKLTEYKGIETILPEGNYSMCPIISADNDKELKPDWEK